MRRLSSWILCAGAAGWTACAGPEGVPESVPEDGGAAAAAGGPYRVEPYQAEPIRVPRTTGEVMLECERHLRVWQEAMAAQRSEENRENIWFTERAIATLVRRHQKELEEQAVSGPPRNRAIASAALGFSGSPEVLHLICGNLRDPDEMVSANALLGLGVLAAADTPLAPLHEIVLDPGASQQVLSNAAFAGLRLAEKLRNDPGGGLSAALLPLLGNGDAAVRAQAAGALGLVRAAHAVPTLSDLLLADESSSVRTAAAFALGEIGSPGSTTVLMQALEDPDRVTAGTARGSLVKIHGRDLGPTSAAWQATLTPR